jgi:hypothetical protein
MGNRYLGVPLRSFNTSCQLRHKTPWSDKGAEAQLELPVIEF